MKDFPVITLCGSMRFFEAMLTIARDLTAKGFIVLAPFVIAETPELKTMLDAMHRCKIDKSSVRRPDNMRCQDAFFLRRKDTGYVV